MKRLPPAGVRFGFEPFTLIEAMVFLTAEASNIVDDAPHYVPGWATACEVAVFALIRIWMPRHDAPLGRKFAFVAGELAILVVMAAGAMSGAIIIVNIAFMLRSAQLFEPRDSYLLSAGVLAAVLFALAAWSRGGGVSWSTIGGWVISLALSFAMVAVLTTIAASERLAGLKLRAANEELRHYAASAADVAATNERTRIAAELHDAIGHELTALNVQLEGAIRLRRYDSVAADRLVASAKELGSVALASVRSTVARLRADPLERDALDVVLRRICERFQRHFALPVEHDMTPVQSKPALTTTIARIAEEALVNATRHAGAQRVIVRLERKGDRNVLKIIDDGIGFEPELHADGHGMTIMRERADASNIELRVSSTPGCGTTVGLTWHALPIAEA